MAWFQTVPKLPEAVTCAAWRQRAGSPCVDVRGGVNARMATLTVEPRTQWATTGRGQPDLAQRYAQADFDPERFFFVALTAGHAGTETWPSALPTLTFPAPPDAMDAWVAETAGQEARRVRLRGLVGAAHLNGRSGTVGRGSWDAASGRWSVALQDRTVAVRPTNIEFLN